MFYSILKGLFNKFPENNIFIFYACFCSNEPVEQNFHFNWYIPCSLDCFFITKKNFTKSLFHTLRDNFLANEILPHTQICKFGRTKVDTHTVLLCNKVLISLFILLQVVLSS